MAEEKKKWYKRWWAITIWIFSFLLSSLSVTANHGGRLTKVTPNPTGISPITWMIFIAITLGMGYFFYWMFSGEKKKF